VPIPAAAEEQDALFQAIIRKIPSIDEPERLREATDAALALLLRRPSDRPLRDELTRRVESIVGRIRSTSAEARRAEIHRAARECLEVLRTAREQRLSRSAEAAHGAVAKVRRAPKPPPPRRSRAGLWVGGGVGLVVLLGGLVWALVTRPPSDTGASDATRLVEQMVAALQGESPPTHVFGGALTLISRGGLPVVVAESVPPRACAAAGWALMRKGLLTINGVTPNRVSAARITDLCNLGEGDATIMWMPK
jgi:hypothetical protein